jgi:hypothetical protein
MDAAWNTLRFLETEPSARKYLSECYRNIGLAHPDRAAFQQSSRFLYTWKQARSFYQASTNADLLIRPLLLFYGCTHLLKGVLLTLEPAYPQNSRVLQHGVTTRKLKRNPYQLMEDEVRPQKEGFFAELAKAFGPTLLKERYLVKELFGSLAALSDAYAAITGESQWHVVQTTTQADGSVIVTFPFRSDGALGFSPETFRQYLQRFAPSHLTIPAVEYESVSSQKQMRLTSEGMALFSDHPLFQRDQEKLYLWNGIADTLPLPVWVSHYLLLYVLSMLCRYETEWWGELVWSHSYAETFLIEHFLTYHERAFPTVIMEQMQKNNTLFLS